MPALFGLFIIGLAFGCLVAFLYGFIGAYLRDRKNQKIQKVNEWGLGQLRQQQVMRRYGQEPSVMDIRTIPSPKEWRPLTNVIHL